MEDQQEFSHQESLDTIVRMIEQAKVNVNQGSFHLLLWGWIIFAASLGHFLLLKLTDVPKPYYIWFLVIPGVLISFIYGFMKGRKQNVGTYADKIYMWTWLGFFFSFLVLVFISGGGRNIGPYVLVLAGFATFLSGHILKFKPLIAGGVLFWVFSMGAHILSNEYGLLMSAASVLTGYLIPGYLLKNKVKDVTF